MSASEPVDLNRYRRALATIDERTPKGAIATVFGCLARTQRFGIPLAHGGHPNQDLIKLDDGRAEMIGRHGNPNTIVAFADQNFPVELRAAR